MPAVSRGPQAEFSWEPKLTDPDLAVAKGAALYAAGQTVRFVDTGAESEGEQARRTRPATAARRAGGPAGR